MASKCLDPDVWKNWDRQGKMSFTKACQECIKDSTSEASPLLSMTDASIGLTRLIHDLVWNGINGVLRKDAVVGALKDILVIHKDLPSIVLDVLGVIDGETSCTDNTSEERQRFCLLMKETEKFIAEKLLKERLEIETLQDIGTLKNKNFYTKFIKVKTKLYYKQKKFNLFREESEGYSKLVSELNQDVSENVTVKKMLEVIISLVGCFNLDPNRVLDVILESFECHPERHQLFIPLLQFYNPDAKTLCEVLGFKFCYYQSSAEETTPKTLYTLTALMIQHGIIMLEDIFCWLVPDNRSIQRAWDAEMKAAKEFVRKLNILSTKDKETEEPPEEVEDVVRLFNANQKYGLCEALLLVGDWTHAEQLTRKFPEYCAMEQPPIARATIRLVHSLIEPVYRRNTGLPSRFNGDVIPPPTSPLAPQPATNLVALRDNVFPMLLALGPWLHYDAALMYKVLRVSKVILTNVEKEGTVPPHGDSLYYDVITLIDDVVLPSLSFMECNCCIAEEVWDVLKLLPYQCRYCLYSRWKNETYLQHSKLLRKRGEGEKKIKAIMKRVSKDTTKPVGRLLGKLTHCAPGCLFDYVLVQIQMYDNLINPVVDSLKYLTSLSYDVLGYCLVETLASADKDRLMHDGTSLSLWLQSLAAFCGAMFKKYNIELTGLLQYVCNQLKAKKSLDLLILKEIIQKMAGIEAAEEMTNDQLEAMAGGDLLKAEAGYFSQVRNTKKSSQRLKESLNVDNLAVALCLSMAQQRYGVVYKETERNHLKLVGKLYDQCQDALVQFGTFLGMTLSVEEYVAKLPTINSMLADYHIHADVAFFLARPMFTHAITLQFEGMRKADSNWKKLTLAAKHQKYCEAASEVMSPIVTSVRPLHAAKVWEDISPQFLVTFWSLTMYDLFVPADSYQREVNKLKAQAMQAADSKEMSSSSSKGKKEQERFASMVDKLQDEKKKQAEHVEKVMSRLKLEKDSWFLSRSAKSAKNETITQFLQLCLFPRCIFTAVDAVYCAKFVHTIHSLKTANFSTLLCYDRLFCDITYSVTSCTENEANRYGRFLCAMLETVMRWHADKATFDRECSNYPGFVTKFRVSNQFSEANDHVGYENYRHVCHKWHYKITKAMVVCLDSKDYVQIRNSLIILIKIMPHFPVLAKLGQIIEKKIEKVREEEKAQRQDLYILATSYSGQLKAKAANMIRENDFHQVSEKVFKVHEVPVKSESNGVAPGAAVAGGKQVNGEAKEAKKDAAAKESKAEKRTSSRAQEAKAATTKKESTPGKEKSEKVKDKDQEGKEKPAKIKKEKEDRRDDEKRKEKKEASAQREERGYRESERYTEMPLSKEDPRYYSSGGGGGGGGNTGGGSYYAMAAHDDRELSSVSNSSGGSHRRSQEPPEVERDAKRRKVDGSTSASKMSKHEERRQQQQTTTTTMQDQPPTSTSSSSTTEKTEKRMSKTKDKTQREKNAATEEEKELRKERKLGRKRDRAEEAQLAAEQKRRKEEDKALKAAHQNGEQLQEQREKHHYAREKSPYARERSHERDGRDKHRRSGGETKRR